MTPLKTRLAKAHWAWMNPEKVKSANKRYRELHKKKTNAQAAARMRRYRQRQKKS